MTPCSIHPRQKAVHACCECAREFCRSCITLVEGEPVCELCLQAYIVPEPTAEEERAGLDVPWLRFQELGPVHAFVATAAELFVSPREFYRRIGPATSWGAAVLFAVICIAVIWFPIYVIHLTVLVPAVLALSEQSNLSAEASERIAEAQTQANAITQLDILLVPIQYFLLYILISAVIQQWVIMAFRGKGNLAVTMQVRCYAMAVQCLAVIPMFGFFLAELANLIICAYGFRETQRISMAQAFLVSSIPVLIFMLLIYNQ